MDLKELGPKLERVMGIVPVCEGVILAKISGKVIIGQTLTEMDHAAISKKVAEIFQISIEKVDKGPLVDLTLGMEKGVVLAVKKGDDMLIGILGSDGMSSVGLLLRQLKNIMK